MTPIGQYNNKQIFWLDYTEFSDKLPDKNWLCLAIANKQPDIDRFDQFVRASILGNILEFKGYGQFGEHLNDLFDEISAIMETLEDHKEINVMTTFHNGETLEDTLWQCFFATSLSQKTEIDPIKIVCTDLDGVNRTAELKRYIKEFEEN
ncbi:MAG: hypothetical protein LBE37_06570 [Sphingobacterium sp.]|jgi:hypothetical protein|nr:hypothetical protein [Sphingobacterium sp.]